MDKKPADRGVADSIRRLRERRYMTKGPGAKKKRLSDLDQGVHADLTMGVVEQLRAKVAEVKVKPAKKKKAKKRGRR